MNFKHTNSDYTENIYIDSSTKPSFPNLEKILDEICLKKGFHSSKFMNTGIFEFKNKYDFKNALNFKK